MASISPEKRALILRAIQSGKSHSEIAKTLGVSKSTVSAVRNDKKAEPRDRVLDLEAEVAHLREERNAERKRASESARERGLFQSIVELLSDNITAIKPLSGAPPRKPKKGAIQEACVMHLSDGHHDEVVRPEEVGGLEKHDFSVSCCRAEQYVETVIDWTQNTLSPKFHFQDLYVLAYGDHTSGEIHNHVPRSAFQNQFKNCLAIGKLHSFMYRDLAGFFEKIHVVYLSGNHARRSKKKDYTGAQDNWDYLIAEIARLYCSDLERVDFLIPDSFSANIEIEGVGCNVFHGDDVPSYNSIPWYGLQRRQRNLCALPAAGPRVRYYFCGHFHKPSSLGDVDGEMLINGPWVATDAYSYNRFAGYTEPTQWVHGMNKKYGISWRLNVNLRSSREAEGPKRYIIEL